MSDRPPESTPASRPLVWIPHPIDPPAVERLAQHADVAVGYGEGAVEFGDVADRVEAILLRTAQVTGEQIRSAPRLKIVARHGVGVDTVDVEAATEAGVLVTNTPTSNVVSVAEHTIAMLLALRRNLPLADRLNQAGTGHTGRSRLTGRELAGAVLGLVGFGRIACRVAAIARDGFDMTVLAHDPGLSDDEVRRRGAAPVTLDELVRQADVVSLHVPLLPTTRHLVGEAELAAMKPGALVLNTARGGTLDEQALLTLLEKGHLGGAALDVTETEPLPPGHPLLARPDVLITPHIAGQTTESLHRVALDAADEIIDVLHGRAPAHSVNRPSVTRLPG